MTEILFELNGRPVQARVEPNQSLIEVLRTQAGAIDVKHGCGEGVCGTCTVLLDGEPVNSCLIFAVQADGASVTTLRGLAAENGELHPLQESFLRQGGSQCGFCTPGMVLTAYWFLGENPHPTRYQIRDALAGNLCRCTGYTKIVDAVEDAVGAVRRDREEAGHGH
jgi:aerobic carbon-monoxide dehydrogenase small subunit